MFSSLGLFQNVACPDKNKCSRPRCIFSHRTDLPSPPPLHVPVDDPKPSSVTPKSGSVTPKPSGSTIPAKRPATQSPHRSPGLNNGGSEPPRKLQKLSSAQKQSVAPGPSHTSTGVPLLRINAARSLVAIPVRQALLKTIYDHFLVLYEDILPTNPTLASEHALRQEDEVYKNSNKSSYRNAVITSIASMKRRPKPDSASHPSVGTEGEIAARAELKRTLNSLRVTQEHLAPLMLSEADMRKWGYILDIPEGPGGTKPSQEGHTMVCERCKQPYMVKCDDKTEDCRFHYGKPTSETVNGERMRIYTCCSRPSSEGGGCVRGPHVFYESDPTALHSRHAFSFSRSPSQGANGEPSNAVDTALDVAAMDCEMIYTTGGMRCARVSVVDGSGAEVFDELVRMDDGVEIIDYNTRFSGITPENHADAVLPLTSIRTSLDAFINSDTILVGHALDNDLKTLRMIHHRCVDTAILFPHKAGVPYRRALKDLVKEHLGTLIQTAGAAGHSSVEDSAATLDLVRWYVLNKPKVKRVQPGSTASSITEETVNTVDD